MTAISTCFQSNFPHPQQQEADSSFFPITVFLIKEWHLGVYGKTTSKKIYKNRCLRLKKAWLRLGNTATILAGWLGVIRISIEAIRKSFQGQAKANAADDAVYIPQQVV
jgi:hypothetical protein